MENKLLGNSNTEEPDNSGTEENLILNQFIMKAKKTIARLLFFMIAFASRATDVHRVVAAQGGQPRTGGVRRTRERAGRGHPGADLEPHAALAE